jgi:cobalamin biosynthesis Mg chelatase CobN
MKRTYWVIGACLSLLLLGGLAFDVSAQQSAPPAAAPSAPPTETTKPEATPSQPAAPSPAAPSGQMRQDTPQPPSTNTIERSTEKTTVVDRDSGRIFGMQPTVAMIIGAVLLVVIVLGLVAMSRRGDTTEVHHEHHHRV